MSKAKVGSRHKRDERAATGAREPRVYRGKQAKTGNSLGLRFERALFRSHPEFSGEVEARIIGPGRMLVIANTAANTGNAEEDPVLSSFLSFLAADMQRAPARITPLKSELMEGIGKLVNGVKTSADEDLGDGALL